MSDWIDVGGGPRRWWFLGLSGVAVCLLLAGGVMLARGRAGGPEVLTAGAVCGLLAVLAAVATAARRRCVQITEDGFRVVDRRGERAYTDDEVICASVRTRPHYSAGELKATTRVFDLWVEGTSRAERIEMVTQIRPSTPDALSPLIDRIHEYLYRRAVEAIENREAFEGEGWTLHPGELVVARRRTTDAVRIDELAAVDVFDDNICVWRRGEDEACACIPLDTANAYVLAQFLRNHVNDDGPDAHKESGGGLGRLLFERKSSRLVTLCAAIIPIGIASILAAAVIGAWLQRRNEPLILGAVLALTFGAIWVLVLSRATRLRCYEHGLVRYWLRRETQLRYSDLETFQYSAVPQYVKGVYAGTTFTLTFVSSADGRRRKLTHSTTLRSADNELERLRDHVSRVIALRMAADFQNGKVVDWTDGLRFLPEGLEYRKAGLLGRKPAEIFSYDEIQGFDTSQGPFHLWVTGNMKPVIKENVTQANFIPGLMLLGDLLASRHNALHAEAS